MENASKALIIAGGMLIAMITISIFYFMFNQISTFKDNTQTNFSQKELQDFNAGFIAYNKKLMYGTDVISVLNKARDNNERYEIPQDQPDNNYYVDVEVILKKQLVATVTTYKRVNGYTEKYDRVETKDLSGATALKPNFLLSEDYETIRRNLFVELKDYDEKGKVIYTQNPDQVKTETDTGYTITTYPAGQFKKKTFRCAEVRYHDNGRVSYMRFEEFN